MAFLTSVQVTLWSGDQVWRISALRAYLFLRPRPGRAFLAGHLSRDAVLQVVLGDSAASPPGLPASASGLLLCRQRVDRAEGAWRTRRALRARPGRGRVTFAHTPLTGSSHVVLPRHKGGCVLRRKRKVWCKCSPFGPHLSFEVPPFYLSPPPKPLWEDQPRFGKLPVFHDPPGHVPERRQVGLERPAARVPCG